ncbi:MAG: hypothetical protein L3J22_01535 [Xanthomonadales bacterium]|nr:hypothetical protein [Xanthomonadales bacterium]
MSKDSPNLALKYAVIGFFAGIAGAFISQQMGYHDGGLNNYFTYAAGAAFGGAIGGMIRKRQGKVS